MKTYTDFFQRLVSMTVYAALAVLLVVAFFIGFLIFCYVLAALIVIGLLYKVYLSFKKKEAPASSHVHTGHFKQGPGRIIEHSEKEDDNL